MDRMKMGVIGLGMGRGHARGYHSHEQADLVAICDMDEGRLHEVQSELDVPRTYTDAEAMFEAEVGDDRRSRVVHVRPGRL